MRNLLSGLFPILAVALITGLQTNVAAQTAETHRSLLSQSAQALGFSTQAQAVLDLGVSDPDVRNHDNAAAHGQTICNMDGQPLQKPDQSLRNFTSYLRGKGRLIRRAVVGSNTAHALYLLGYSAHAIQDFAIYQGMTRAELAYLSQKGMDPSANPENTERGKKYTQQLFQAARTAIGGETWDHLLRFTGDLPMERELSLLAGSKSGTNEQRDDEQLRAKFEQLPAATRSVRWEGLDERAQEIIAAFADGLREEIVPNPNEDNEGDSTKRGKQLDDIFEGGIRIPHIPGLPNIPGLDSLTRDEASITTSIKDARGDVPYLDGYTPIQMKSLALCKHGANGGWLLKTGAYGIELESY